MQLLKHLFLSGILAIGSANVVQAANVHALLEPATEKLDYRFFYWLFDQEDLPKAYAQAQKEDFEAGAKVLFTPEMLSLFKYPQKDWEDKLGSLDAFWNLEGELKSLNDGTSVELLQEWRYTFLTRMMDFIRLQSQRKPIFKAMVMNELKSDSNVKRVTDEDFAKFGDASGKSDGQHMLFINLKWMPFANYENFSKKNAFEQSFNSIRMHQFAHEENQVQIFNTESKYTRKINSTIEDFSLAYRLQNFGLGSVGTRDTHSIFNTHRFKADWDFKALELGGNFNRTKTSLSIQYTLKQQLNDIAVNAGKDANEIRYSWDQDFDYKFGDFKGKMTTSLEYNDYSTDHDANGNYDYLQFKLKNSHSYDCPLTHKTFRLNEELGWRSKDWNTNTTPADEHIYWVQAKASTKLCPTLDSSLTLKQTWLDSTSGGKDTSGDQTIVALGLTWSTP